jgi:hypothetical protein
MFVAHISPWLTFVLVGCIEHVFCFCFLLCIYLMLTHVDISYILKQGLLMHNLGPLHLFGYLYFTSCV